MKKIIFLLFICLGTAMLINAQETTSTQPSLEDYERMIDSRMEVRFRNHVIKTLGLTEAEIIAFDPIYRSYMNEKSALMDKKMKLMDKYSEEIKEDDSVKNEEEDTADFIERYWEVEIDEMELKKDYFDKMEDKMAVQKAMNFFLLEKIAQNNLERNYLFEQMPAFVFIEKSPTKKKVIKDQMPHHKMTDNKDMKKEKKMKHNEEMTAKNMPIKQYKKEIDAYSKWVMNHEGKVDLSHQYTHDGLDKLVNAISAVAAAGEVNVENMEAERKAIQALADELRVNKWSGKHADIAKDAFMKSAALLKSVQSNSRFAADATLVNELSATAMRLNNDEFLTDQATTVKAFFKQAERAVNAMSQKCNW